MRSLALLLALVAVAAVMALDWARYDEDASRPSLETVLSEAAKSSNAKSSDADPAPSAGAFPGLRAP